MDSDISAEAAAINKHKKFMFIGNKKRYIEVLQCSGEDMNLVLTNGISMPSPTASVSMMPPQQPLMQRPLMSPGMFLDDNMYIFTDDNMSLKADWEKILTYSFPH